MTNLENTNKLAGQLQDFLQKNDPNDAMTAMLNIMIYTLIYNGFPKEEFLKDINSIWNGLEKVYKKENANDKSD